jgi:tetratricopeptide (TPR) repeat protein
MRIALPLMALLFALGSADAQRHKIDEVNAEKPDGLLLQQIGQEENAAKKIDLMEQFLVKYPRHEGVPWMLEMLQPAYVKAGNIDKVIATGERMFAIDPNDIECALQTLKAVETKKDPDAIKKWSAATSAAARKFLAGTGEKSAGDVDYAKQVDTYTEYALYRAAVENPDPKRRIDLIETLEQRNPKCEYVPKLQQPLFTAYRQAGDNAKALALAEKILATDQSDEEMLIVAADNYFNQKKEPDKVHAYCARIVEILDQKPKPQGVADGDWNKRKHLFTGMAHYMSGKLYYTQSKFAPADKELRAALPLIEGNATMKPEVLYLLGFANYKLEKAQEAADFYKACAAIKSPFQALAAKNLAGVKSQYRGIR